MVPVRECIVLVKRKTVSKVYPESTSSVVHCDNIEYIMYLTVI